VTQRQQEANRQEKNAHIKRHWVTTHYISILSTLNINSFCAFLHYDRVGRKVRNALCNTELESTITFSPSVDAGQQSLPMIGTVKFGDGDPNCHTKYLANKTLQGGHSRMQDSA